MNRASTQLFFKRSIIKQAMLAAVFVAVIPVTAQAGDLSYNYLQGGYQVGHSGSDFHGWSGDGSVAIGQNFQLQGGYARNNHDVNNGADRTVNAWNLGGGFHTGISDKTDFVANVDYTQSSVDGVSRDLKDYSGEVGVRSALAPHFEGWAMLGYGDTHNPNNGNNNDKVFGKLGGQYKFNKTWGLVAEGRASSGNRGLFVGPRVSF